MAERLEAVTPGMRGRIAEMEKIRAAGEEVEALAETRARLIPGLTEVAEAG